MSEDIYAKPDLTKKVRFQAASKEDGNKDACEDVDDARIYDNYWAEESPPQDQSQDQSQDKSKDKSQDKSQDNTTEDQQKTASVNVSSGKKTRPGAAALFLGLLCLLFLVAVIVLVVVFILEKNRLSGDNANLISERNELQTSYIKIKSLNVNLTSERNELQTSNKEMKSLNVNLTSERDELQTSNSHMKSLNADLTKKTSQLEIEKGRLNATNKNLTKERDEFKRLAEKPSCSCPWITFGSSCYLVVTSRKNWRDSRTFCQGKASDLAIISSLQEQTFISSLNQDYWIGLTDEESEGEWKWVDRTVPTEKYWRKDGQPDNYGSQGEDCAEISDIDGTYTWNDLPCSSSVMFICEKMR
ncbi:CD209 antigen-like protein B [Sebastes umbrosus]|uniref:CD209 antigen-like protein B n=1 Tax=Sebastes umbrosus TaxID=72105 RepID=UPI00189C719D|nr:CD209 antigen-like protein B [Sebastes umbrosus]